MSAKGAALLKLTGALSNHAGAIVASHGQAIPGRDMQAASIDNAGGQVSVAGNPRLQAGSLSNTAGASIGAQGDATLRLDHADNTDSRITANGIDLAGLNEIGVNLNNQGGLVGSAGDARLLARTLNNVGGTLNAGRALTATTDSLYNRANSAGASHK